METVRTFFAEWITASAREAKWEPEIPTACVDVNREVSTEDMKRGYLTSTCQRELQGQVASMLREEENVPTNAALIMLFILGFPLLSVKAVGDGEVDAHNG